MPVGSFWGEGMLLVGLIFTVLGRVVLLSGKLTLVLPIAYTRKRAAKRHFVAELRKQGLSSEVIDVMLVSYQDMLSLNPLSYRKVAGWRTER